MRLSLLHLAIIGATLAAPPQNHQKMTNAAVEGGVIAGEPVAVMQRSPAMPVLFEPHPIIEPHIEVPPKVPTEPQPHLEPGAEPGAKPETKPLEPGTKPNEPAKPPPRLGVFCRRDNSTSTSTSTSIDEEDLIELGLWW